MIDVRVFGVEERIDNIRITQKKLSVPDEKVFIDYNRDGVVPTAKRAWTYPTEGSHVMVLQDDIELSNGFLDICNIIAKTHPKKIVSLFPYQFMRRPIGMRKMVSPYIRTRVLSGCGIIMPAEYIKPCIESFPEDAMQDDTMIYNWAKSRGVWVITTIPAILQHIGDDSVIDPKKAIRRTVFYEENPVADWSNPKIYLHITECDSVW